MFIVFEGINGVGKTTQISLLKQALEGMGKKVHCFQAPWSVPWAEQALQGCSNRRVRNAMFQAILHELDHMIQPVVESAEVLDEYVLLDRWVDSYYAHARHYVWPDMKSKPDLILVLTMDLNLARERARHQEMEDMGLVQNGFIEMAHTFPHKRRRIHVLREDTPEDVHKKVMSTLWAS